MKYRLHELLNIIGFIYLLYACKLKLNIISISKAYQTKAREIRV